MPVTFRPMAFTASSSLSLRLPVINTYAPSCTNSFAVASAMPDVAAVITATFPSSFPIAFSSSELDYFGYEKSQRPAPRKHCARGAGIGLAEAAAGEDLLARKPAGIVRREEYSNRSDIIR